MSALAILVTTALIALQPSAGSREWFEKTEQTLMDAVASGDHAVWDQIMDDACVMTGEEGEQLTKAAFLKALRPLPQGLSGEIVVRDLTVQDLKDVAIVRYLADES